MNHLLSRYVRLVIESTFTKDARVPSQLIDADSDNEPNDDVNEFSGAGAIAGFTAPLGMSANDLNGKKKKTQR